MKMYEPMLAKPSSLDFLRQVEDNPDWVAVEKYDGYRELLYLSNQGNHLYSRYGNDHILNCPQFQAIVSQLDGTVLDCEGMAPTRRLEDNAACFKAYPESAAAWQKANGNAYLIAFDVLAYKGEDVTGIPFGFRRVYLDDAFLLLEDTAFREHLFLEGLTFEGKEVYYRRLVVDGGEGIILKDLRAVYTPGKRTSAWLKVKRLEQHEYFICGFLPAAEGKFEGLIGSVMYTDSPLNPAIGTASGMDNETRVDMTVRPGFYVGKKALFECQSITSRGCMRHPRWQGLIKEGK